MANVEMAKKRFEFENNVEDEEVFEWDEDAINTLLT